MLRRPKSKIADAGEILVFVADNATCQGVSMVGPFAAAADALREHPADYDQVTEILRVNKSDNTIEDVTEEFAWAWCEMQSAPWADLQHVPAFVEIEHYHDVFPEERGPWAAQAARERHGDAYRELALAREAAARASEGEAR